MSYPIGRQESYDSLLPYLPEDAQRVLTQQIPKIRKQLDVEIDDFIQSLGCCLKEQIDAETKAISAEAAASIEQLEGILAKVTAAASDPIQLAAATADLKASIKAYQDRWKSMGTAIQKAALLAAKSMGVPIPG